MIHIIKILAVLAECVARLLLFWDKEKREARDAKIAEDPVGNFEHRFGQLQPDAGDKSVVSTGTAESVKASPSSTGTGDISSRS